MGSPLFCIPKQIAVNRLSFQLSCTVPLHNPLFSTVAKVHDSLFIKILYTPYKYSINRIKEQ